MIWYVQLLHSLMPRTTVAAEDQCPTLRDVPHVSEWFDSRRNPIDVHTEIYANIRGSRDEDHLALKIHEVDERTRRLLLMRMLPDYSKEVTAASRIGVGFLTEYEWKLFVDQKSLDVEPDVKVSSLRVLGFSGRIQQRLERVRWPVNFIPPLMHKDSGWACNKWKDEEDGTLFRAYATELGFVWNSHTQEVRIEFRYVTQWRSPTYREWLAI